MLGQSRESIEQAMAASGLDPDQARAEIELALANPYLKGGAVLSERIKKREWLLKSYAKLANQFDPLTEVPRRHQLPADEFYAEFYFRHRPVLLTGLMEDWPAMSKWSLDYFEQVAGDKDVEVQFDRESDATYEINTNDHRKRMPFRDFLGLLRSGQRSNDYYMTANNDGINQQALGALWQDAGRIDGYLDSSANGGRFFWMGPRGTITPYHHDLTNNLLVQVRGTKRVRMVASHDTPLMRNHLHCYSEWDTDSLPPGDAGEFRPQVLTCDIKPGEALFLPVGWWHHVEAVTTTIGCSFTNFTRDNNFHTFYDTYGPV